MTATPELPSKYDPAAAQEWCLKFWNEKGYFHSDPVRGKKEGKKPFTIVIPPPNVTGALHMGHALDNTLQDVLIRWRRMQGYEACWIPGTDHAGIATQAVVEKRLLETEKKNRHDVGREGLVERIWKWKDQYECRILGQLKQLGCSADWDRTRFTLDEMCSKAVRQTFFNFFKDGLIYRGKRLVNWDTHLQTAVADDEIYHEKTNGHFWTFKYPVVDDAGKQISEYLTFSTTRPETMLADVAVAIHPDDERYKHLHGKKLLCPLVNRVIPIITDGILVDPTLGTGAVKVTPAHDPNDYQCGLRHKLEMLSMMKADGTISEVGGKYQGLTMPEARKAVVADMEALGLLEKVEDREIDLAHSDRSKTPIEPFLSDQWFVKMSDEDGQGAAHEVSGGGRPGLAQLAMDAVTTGRVKFFPERYAKTYLDWLGEKRDWCISRQLWWGHRIPVWRVEEMHVWKLLKDRMQYYSERVQSGDTNNKEGEKLDRYVLLSNAFDRPANKLEFFRAHFGDAAHVEKIGVDLVGHPVYGICPNPAKANDVRIDFLSEIEAKQDDDVLDTWFSSGLWPHSTLGWPDKTPEMAYYYPTSVLVTSRDIITLWVARMVLMSLSNLGEVPFNHVYIHPKVLDGFGEGMSKSKGNGVDPLDVISIYGTDALRFVICQMATETQDARLPVANVCPHCQTLVPVKQEHMYMRTKKLACPSCKKQFRPGGPWPSEDAELPTAKQTSDKFELGRNFATKLWNASRFVMMNLSQPLSPNPSPQEDEGNQSLKLEDRWILSRLATVTQQVTQHLDSYEIAAAARLLYDFTWTEFCDWYLEMAKARLKIDGEKALAQQMLVGILDNILRLLHPMMPFVTEMIWQALNEVAPQRGLMPSAQATATDSIMIADWPTGLDSYQDKQRESQIARMQDLIKSIRNTRNEYRVDEKATVTVSVKCSDAVAKELEPLKPFIQSLGKVGELQLGSATERPQQAGVITHADFTAYVHLAGLIDVAAEIKRLEKQLAEKEKNLANYRNKLNNAGFLAKAPTEVVTELRESEEATEQQIAVLKETLDMLKR
ncbi:MAG: valine--tRNA ligase [Planctomycetia bacterium]|nr:valine--tRNA ligase [Planctomycetia bacterium]